MGEHCQVRSCSWSKTPKRCSAEAMPGEFILVDDDNEVIILDTPESMKWKSSRASRKRSRSSLQGVISIDDEDDNGDNDTHNADQPFGDDLGSGDSSRGSPAANLHRPPEVDDDECQVIQGKCSTFRFAKCKQTFSNKASSGNRFGLGSESESDCSESDCSDCEILEGSYREVREQWEKAFLRKMYKAGKVNISSGLPEETSPSGRHCDTNPCFGFENGAEQHAQTSSSFASQNSDAGKQNLSFFSAAVNDNFCAASSGAPMEEDIHANTSFCNEEISQGPSLWSNMEEIDGRFDADIGCSDRDQQHSNLKQDHDHRSNLNHQKNDTQSEYFCFSKRRHPAEMQAQHEEVTAPSPENDCLHESVRQTGNKESEERLPGMQAEQERPATPSTQNNCSREPLHQTSFKEGNEQLDELQVEHEGSTTPCAQNYCSREPVHQTSSKEGEEQLDEMQVPQETSASPSSKKRRRKEPVQKFCTEEVEEQLATESSPLATQTSDRGAEDTLSVPGTENNAVRGEHSKSSLSEMEESVTSPTPSTSGKGTGAGYHKTHIPGVDRTAIEIDIIYNREKLKETDEYKKAADEEWEARHLQLQIQAGEAQRLRKRRKLESMRKLETERRQKERIEKMREIQKKDEENMDLKEQVRAEVSRSLKRLEILCLDMASLLRGLGVPVGGGALPSQHEVHAAYRRALLKFHPDRASRGDIRQQVEAEEKFKLMARMKEKFLSAS